MFFVTVFFLRKKEVTFLNGKIFKKDIIEFSQKLFKVFDESFWYQRNQHSVLHLPRNLAGIKARKCQNKFLSYK